MKWMVTGGLQQILNINLPSYPIRWVGTSFWVIKRLKNKELTVRVGYFVDLEISSLFADFFWR